MGKFFCDNAARCLSCGKFLRATDIARNEKHLYPIGTLFSCPCGAAEVWTNSIRDEEALVAFIAGETRRYYQGFCCDLFDGKGNVVQPIRSAEWEGEEQRGQILGSKEPNGRVREFAIAWRSRFLPEGEDATEALIAWYEKNLGAVKALVREMQAIPNKSGASPLDNPAFRRWFGDSKVVDEDGEPLVVYHGGFDVIGSEAGTFKQSEDGLLGPGIYFTPERAFAETYLWKQKGAGAIGAYVLKVESPLVVFSNEPVSAISERIRKFRRKGLIDGVVLLSSESGLIEEIVVFSSKQVKAAFDNDGTFDPDSADVRKNPERTFIPPARVAAEARYGLELRAAQPPSNRCCTDVGIRRAVQLANRQPVSVETLKRMRSYFQRHAVDERGRGWGVDSKGFQAWLLWGGDSGEAWCNRILDELGEAP